MNSFLDQLDTNTVISVELDLTPIFDLYAPQVAVKINGNSIFGGYLTATKQFRFNLGLLEHFELSLELTGKKYSTEHETAVAITDLRIDGINIIPRFLSQAHYVNDHNYNLPTHYLGFNGIWTLKMAKPFYQWLHGATDQGWLLEP